MRKLFPLLAVFLYLAPHVGAAAFQRTANTTLTLPTAPPKFGYALTEAFPGIRFSLPLGVVNAPGDSNRVFILEKAGRIQVVRNITSTPVKSVFLDLSSRTVSSREWGLLGLAFHPDYLNNGFVYVFYTPTDSSAGGSGTHNRLSRFSIDPANTNQVLANSELILLNQMDNTDTHNAGDLHFGADGYLYVALGDEGGGGDDNDNSQKITKDYFSAIMRIDVDKKPGNLLPNSHPAATTNYLVPADNPFIGRTNFNGLTINSNNVRTEFWAVGFRNPWRMSFDRPTGRLFVGDVGQDEYEEINVVTKGANYGWVYREGPERYRNTPPAGHILTDPYFWYDHGDGESVTGGVVYRGSKLDLVGQYIFGDYVSGDIWALDVSGPTGTNLRHLTDADSPAAFGTDPSNGDILIAEVGNQRLQRLVYSSTPIGNPIPATLSAAGAFSSLETLTPNAGIVPYEINVPFWSDNAIKSRWFSIPNPALTMEFSPTNHWLFPTSMVWIKHFELTLTNGQPPKRLETRFLVNSSEGFYGVTYRWGNSTTNATLVGADGTNDTFVIRDGSTTRTQVWRYPGRNECLTCHNSSGGRALGFGTAQLNRAHDYAGLTENQVRALSDAGYFSQPVASVDGLPVLRKADDASASLELRVRSYLASNCSSCHSPQGTAQGNWDARFSTPTSLAGIIDGPLINTGGDPLNRVITMGDPTHSMILQRISSLGNNRMPPLGSSVLDTNAIDLLTAWIGNTTTPELRLNVQTIAQGRLELSWPVAESAVVVEATESLLPEDWKAINPTITTSGVNRVVTIQPGSTNSFYRLRR